MKSTLLAILATTILIGGALLVSSKNASTAALDTASGNNITIVDGKQIIEVSAKAGYAPKNSVAKAGMPTVLRFNTNGTFDCSSSVRIPSMNVSKNLPPTGATDIDLGTPAASSVKGICSMGMYSFQIDFRG